MKKLLMFVVCALLALPACAGAEASPTPAVDFAHIEEVLIMSTEEAE